MKLINVKNLTKEFKYFERGQGLNEAFKSVFKRKYITTKAVDDISFNVKRGEVVGFLGPNGAGKSTTIKILTGIMHPTKGEVTSINFIPWKQRKKYVKNIGVVFGQKSQLLWDLPPIDAFYLHKSYFSIPKKEFDEKLNELVKMLDISKIMKKQTRQLSLGERMRCEFVIALLHNPSLVFLDEPTIGLDIYAKEIVRKFIKESNKKFGTTFILTSHDLEDIEHLCHRIIIINKGKIVFNDLVDKLKIGKTKNITLTVKESIEPTVFKKLKGITNFEKISKYVFKFKLDSKKTKLSNLLKEINKHSEIEDLEVVGPTITETIKNFY